MKKLYISLFSALIAFGASARELTFYLGDTKIAKDANIEYNDITIDTTDGFQAVAMEPKLYLSSDIFSANIEVKATCTSGQEIQICAGGECTPGTTVTKDKVKIQTNEKLDLEFHYRVDLGMDEEVPTVTTIFEAKDTKYPDATYTSFTLIMGKTAGVQVIENNTDITVTPAGLVYTLNVPTTLAIYDITGKQALNTQLQGTGVVDTSSLVKGIYIYRAGNTSGKFIVK